MSPTQSDSESSEGDADEEVYFSSRQPKSLVEAAGIENKTQWTNRHLWAEVKGEKIVEAETKNELAREQLGDTVDSLESTLSELQSRGEGSGAVSLEQVEDELTELIQERQQAVEEVNKRRIQEAQQQVAARESDPESVSVQAEKAPIEAAQALVDDTGTVPDTYLQEGPENLGVQSQAEKCGMDPAEFFEFALDELDDAQVEIGGEFGTRYDRSESVATDGGERR